MVIDNIFVLGNRVLIEPKRQKELERTLGGIIVPVVASRDLAEATVVAAGDSVINVAVGDVVLFPAGAGIPFEFDGKEYKFIDGPTKDSPGNIIAII